MKRNSKTPGDFPEQIRNISSQSTSVVIKSDHILVNGEQMLPIEKGQVIVPLEFITKIELDQLPQDLKLRSFIEVFPHNSKKLFDWIEIKKTELHTVEVRFLKDTGQSQWKDIISVAQWGAILRAAVLISFDPDIYPFDISIDSVRYQTTGRSINDITEKAANILKAIGVNYSAFYSIVANQRSRVKSQMD